MAEVAGWISLIFKDILVNLVAGGIIRLFRGDVIFFRGWRRRKALIEPALLYQSHRKHASEDSFWRAFTSNRDVTLVTVKSLHTRNRLKEMLEKGKVSVRSLRILTLNPDMPPPIFDALAELLNEPAANCKTDCREAYETFRDLAAKYEFVSVQRYDSLPTIQGVIVADEYAFVELLTYHSNPDERTALMILMKDSPSSYKLIAERFDRLWQDTKRKSAKPTKNKKRA